MVLKNKISTHYTSDDLIDIVKACLLFPSDVQPTEEKRKCSVHEIYLLFRASKQISQLSIYSQLLQYKSVKSLAFNSFDCVTVKKPAEKTYVSVIFYSQSNCFR